MGYVIPKSVDHLTDPGHSPSHSKTWCAARREEVRTATCRVGSVQQETLEILCQRVSHEKTSGTLLKTGLGIKPNCFSRQVYISLDQWTCGGTVPLFSLSQHRVWWFYMGGVQEMWLTKTMTFGEKNCTFSVYWWGPFLLMEHKITILIMDNVSRINIYNGQPLGSGKIINWAPWIIKSLC